MLQLPKSAPENKNGLWQILVVDHEADVAEICISALKEAGYAVRAASSAGEALELMRARPAEPRPDRDGHAGNGRHAAPGEP